jgi:hypothetical protein
MHNGELHRHIVLSPAEKVIAVEALQVNGYTEAAGAMKNIGNKEVPLSAVMLIMEGMEKLAESGRRDAQRFIGDYNELEPF